MSGEKQRAEKRKKRLKRFLLIILGIAAAVFVIYHLLLSISYPVLREGSQPQTGTWYSVYTEDGAASDGSDWHGLYRKGTENKLLIYFYGGGVSLYGEMDERNEEGFFYSNTDLQDAVAQIGILSDWEINPFRSWSVLALPYATGDFHIGRSVYTYTDDAGEEVTVRHRGYENYSALMEKMDELLGTPETLVVAGSSAGGFASALLTDDILNYLPETENVTVCVDSSMLYYDDWKGTAENFWNAPQEIADRLYSDNILMDSLRALREKRGDDIKLLFTCSVRDRKLQEYQNFIEYGVMEQTKESGVIFQERLWDMADELEAMGNAGVYLFDTIEDPVTGNTRHMMFPYNPFDELLEDTSTADWLMDAVNGTVRSYRAEY